MGRASRAKREGRTSRTLYHFTSAYHAREIMESGVIRTTESNVSMNREHAGPDVVWLLDAPDASGYAHGLDPDPATAARIEAARRAGQAMQNADKREIRFTVRVPADKWFEWAWARPTDITNGMTARDILMRVAGGPEAADHWWVSERPIFAKDWVEIAARTREGEYRTVWTPPGKAA